MSAIDDIQIIDIQLNQIHYTPQAELPPWKYDGYTPAEEQRRRFSQREFEKSRERNIQAVIKIGNVGTNFHSVSLIAYAMESGVSTGQRSLDFGVISPGEVAQRTFEMGKWQWHFGGIVVDNQTHPINTRISTPSPTQQIRPRSQTSGQQTALRPKPRVGFFRRIFGQGE